MSRTRRGLYSFALDGGNGTVLLRGSVIPRLTCFLTASVVTLDVFAVSAGTLLDFGFQSQPSFFATGVDPTAFSPPPAREFNAPVNFPGAVLLAAPEQLVMVISGGVITAGELELLVECVDP
jgi:hypothetical protein